MIVVPVAFATPDFDRLLNLRNEILRIPLGLEFKVEDIIQEYDQIHLAAFEEDQLLGCLSFKIIDDSTVKMRQVAIDQDHQGKGIGTHLVAASEAWATNNNYQKITLHARDVAVPFYEKLDYTKVGELFTEVGIDHYRMEKTL